MTHLTRAARRRSPMYRHRSRGLSLVELMVALGLGLVLVIGVASVYLFTKTAFGRQSQLSTLQQSVRTAFEYLGSDARMVGHMGCSTGSDIATLTNNNSVSALASNFASGIGGYKYKNATAGAYTLTSDSPADSTTASDWNQSPADASPLNTLPIADLGGSLTPGSDVLVIRTVAGGPLRLTGDVAVGANSLTIEKVGSSTCNGGSGFCTNSYGLVASCSAAWAFRVNTIASTTTTVGITTVLNNGPTALPAATSEVFPLQTTAYYVKRSSSGTTTSLYRRVFTGNPDAGDEQELIEDVESMQVRYGIDSTAPDPVGIADTYTTADGVSEWRRVMTVRMSLLMRSATPVTGDTKVPASAPVNGVTITFPTGSRYDRRVFTTTVALRNRIAYFPPAP